MSKTFEGEAVSRNSNEIKKDEIILDIGPRTIKIIDKLIDGSNTVLWNGPAGYFENLNFFVVENFFQTLLEHFLSTLHTC